MTWYYDRNSNQVVSDVLSDVDEHAPGIFKMEGFFETQFLSGVLEIEGLGTNRLTGKFRGSDMESGSKVEYHITRESKPNVVIEGRVYNAIALDGAPDSLPCIVKVNRSYEKPSKDGEEPCLVGHLTHVFPLYPYDMESIDSYDLTEQKLFNERTMEYNAAPSICLASCAGRNDD